MPRLIILLLISAAIAVLAFGNTQPVSLVILGSTRTPEVPFGLLLAIALGVGALLTLLLYGLIGLHRPAQSKASSKYQPIGRRVPYPENSGGSDFSTTSAPYASVGGATSGSAAAYGTASRSTAFVPEPATTPQDSAATPSTPTTDSSPASSYQTAGYQADSSQAAGYQTDSAQTDNLRDSAAYPQASYSDPAATSKPTPVAEPLFKIARPFVDKLTDRGAKKKE